MKKLLVLIMVVVVTMTGCGEKTSIDTKQSSEVEQDELYNSAEKLSESQLQINCNGANNAMISFTDESVNKYLGGDKNYACSLFLSFGDDNLCNLRTDATKWYAYSGECDSVTDEPIWFYDGESKIQKIEGNTISWEMSQEGIGDLLQKCDTYAIGFYANDSVDADFFTEGNAEVHAGDSKNSEGLEMLEVSDDLLIIRVKNNEAVNSHDQSGIRFTINFFDSKEYAECSRFNLILTISEYNTVYAESVEYDDNDYYIFNDITNDNGNREIGKTIDTDYGMAIQIKNSTVVSMVRNQLVYDIEDNDDMHSILAMGYVTDTKISIPAIPEEFVSADPVDFTPITDNYKIIEVTFPECEFGTPGWYQRMGKWVYGPTEPYFSEGVKVIYLLSLNDFDEVVDGKMKIIYASENACKADIFMNFPSYIIAEDLTGVNEPDDSIITPNFLEQCDMEVFNNAESSGFSLEYLGDYTNTRYYNFDYTSDSHDFPTVVGWGFNANMRYSDMQYSNNEILSDTWNEHPIRTYSSR